MTNPSPPIIELVGGDVPSDELLAWLADWLLDLVESEELRNSTSKSNSQINHLNPEPNE